MRRRGSGLLILIWFTLMAICGLLFGVALGNMRYDSLERLYLRVEAEIKTQLATLRPRPEFVPTPLPTTKIDADAFASQLLPTLTATPTPLPTSLPTTSPTPLPTTLPASTPTPLPTSLPASTPTPLPTSLPTTVPTPTPTSAYQPALSAVELTGYTHIWQTWNNCAPANLATNLSFFGLSLQQAEVATALKPTRDDKNVNPGEMVAYARSKGFQARAFVNGDDDRLRLLLSNNIPVLIETWLEEKPNDGLGHYRLLIGYDDARREWIVSDSLISTGVDPKGPYRGIRVPYDIADPLWAVFNRTYIVVYPQELAPVIRGIIGPEMSEATMWQNSLQRFQTEIQERPDDPFAWFNLGTTLVAMGQFEQAATAYDQARTIGLPWRMLWYQFGPFQAYYETGRHQELISLADSTIASGGEIEEIYFWKGKALAALNDLASARQAWRRALELKPTYGEAVAALAEVGSGK